VSKRKLAAARQPHLQSASRLAKGARHRPSTQRQAGKADGTAFEGGCAEKRMNQAIKHGHHRTEPKPRRPWVGNASHPTAGGRGDRKPPLPRQDASRSWPPQGLDQTGFIQHRLEQENHSDRGSWRRLAMGRAKHLAVPSRGDLCQPRRIAAGRVGCSAGRAPARPLPTLIGPAHAGPAGSRQQLAAGQQRPHPGTSAGRA